MRLSEDGAMNFTFIGMTRELMYHRYVNLFFSSSFVVLQELTLELIAFERSGFGNIHDGIWSCEGLGTTTDSNPKDDSDGRHESGSVSLK